MTTPTITDPRLARLREHVPDLRRAPGRYVGTCPFAFCHAPGSWCAATAADGDGFYCFGCGIGGDLDRLPYMIAAAADGRLTPPPRRRWWPRRRSAGDVA